MCYYIVLSSISPLSPVSLTCCQIRTGKLCLGEKQDMKEYYENKLLEVNSLIDTEYSALVAKRASSEGEVKCQQEEKVDPGRLSNSINTVYRLFPSHIRTLLSSPNQFSSSCGVVEFKTFAAKQWGKEIWYAIVSCSCTIIPLHLHIAFFE